MVSSCSANSQSVLASLNLQSSHLFSCSSFYFQNHRQFCTPGNQVPPFQISQDILHPLRKFCTPQKFGISVPPYEISQDIWYPLSNNLQYSSLITIIIIQLQNNVSFTTVFTKPTKVVYSLALFRYTFTFLMETFFTSVTWHHRFLF